MYRIVWHEGEGIEIALDGDLTADEFRDVIYQLESLCNTRLKINVLFDAVNVHNYDFKNCSRRIFELFRNHKYQLTRVALVSDSKFAEFALNMFAQFNDTEFKAFTTDQIKNARKWIFPSRQMQITGR